MWKKYVKSYFLIPNRENIAYLLQERRNKVVVKNVSAWEKKKEFLVPLFLGTHIFSFKGKYVRFYQNSFEQNIFPFLFFIFRIQVFSFCIKKWNSI